MRVLQVKKYKMDDSSCAGSNNGDTEPLVYTNEDITLSHNIGYSRIQRGITHLKKETICIMGHGIYEDSLVGDDVILYDGVKGTTGITKMNATNHKLDICINPISVYCKMGVNKYIFMGIFRRVGKAQFHTCYETNAKGINTPTHSKWVFPMRRIGD